jgi:hypothetical protein
MADYCADDGGRYIVTLAPNATAGTTSATISPVAMRSRFLTMDPALLDE